MGENSGSNLEKLKFVPPELFGDNEISIKRLKACDAQKSFEMIDRYRHELRTFLPWIDFTNTLEEQKKSLFKFEAEWEEKIAFHFYIEFQGQYVGGIGAHNIDFNNLTFEIGYMLFPPFWKKGIIQRAVALFTNEFFKLGYLRSEIRCDSKNIVSALVPLRLGFTFEGTRRSDIAISKIRRDTMVFSALSTDQIEIKKTFFHKDHLFIMRQAGPSDIPNIIACYKKNDAHFRPFIPTVPVHFFDQQFWSNKIFKELQEGLLGNSLGLFLFALDNKTVIGKITLSNIIKGARQAANLGYHIDEDCQGQGIVSSAVKIICHHAFIKMGLHCIEAGFVPHNKKSERVLEKCGFQKCGNFPNYILINGKWEEHVIYQLINKEN